MSQIIITPAQRRELRAAAHHLNPVVLIGANGLTATVKKEIDFALKSHELIKVRVMGDDRVERENIYQTLADELNAAGIQHIGKLLVLWRPKPDDDSEKAIDPNRKAGPKNVKILKHSSLGGQKPEIKTIQVLGNQRITAGGIVKRAKVRVTSIKKKAQD